MMLPIRWHRLLLDSCRGVRPTHEIEWIVKEVLVICKPAKWGRHSQKSEDGERRCDSTPYISMARERKCEDAPDCSAEYPTVIARVNRSRKKQRKQKKASANLSVPCSMDGRHALGREQRY